MKTRFLDIHTEAPLTLRQITIRTATIGLIYTGQKTIAGENSKAGELFCIERNRSLPIIQAPYQGKPYRADLLLIADGDLNYYHQRYPHPLPSARRLTYHTVADENLRESWQRLRHAHSAALPAWQQQHRLHELLLQLRDLGWDFAEPAAPDTVTHIRRLIKSQLEHRWTSTEAAAQLHLSTSTLQRRLKQQHTTFSTILREERLEHALYLLMHRRESIHNIAAECGYSSPGKFAVAFKRRFGLNPSDIK